MENWIRCNLYGIVIGMGTKEEKKLILLNFKIIWENLLSPKKKITNDPKYDNCNIPYFRPT